MSLTTLDLAILLLYFAATLFTGFGIIWQSALTTTGIYLVLQDHYRLAWSLAVVALTSIWLKFNWYNKLEDYPSGFAPDPVISEPQKGLALNP